jgi:hypothetical protein
MKPLEEDIGSIAALEEVVGVGLQMLEEEEVVAVAVEEASQLQDSIHIEPEVAAVFVDFVFGNADTVVEESFALAFVDAAGTVECAVVGEVVDSGELPAAAEAAAADFVVVAGKVDSHSSLPAVDAVHKQYAVVDLLDAVIEPADAVGKD